MSLKAQTIIYLKRALARLGIAVTSTTNLDRLSRCLRLSEDIDFLLHLDDSQVAKCLRALEVSKSQIRQDLFVLSELNFKRHGYFVEFGATNGRDLSNTYMLEKHFSWNGILAEPATCWHPELQLNRRCSIDTRCVWKNSGSRLLFNETEDAILSTLQSFSGADVHKKARRVGTQYEVDTISLTDLLDSHGAPKIIDYLSMDTEGSEFEILNSFDFERYQFRVITCEHNYTKQRESIFNLLSQHGYRRKLQEVSGVDDWYIRSSL